MKTALSRAAVSTLIASITTAAFCADEVVHATIEVSQVRICWNSLSNVVYQVQYRSELTGNVWTSLGGPVLATGRKSCLTDSVTDPRRFYRVVEFSFPTNQPPNMVLIPAGSFTMGDNFAEDSSDERPTHTVYVSAFYMDTTEITKAYWDDVYRWATNRGYGFEFGAQGKATNHPVHTVTWYDAVKWCNARSEKEGRVPAYYTDVAQTTVYRTGLFGLQNALVKWNAGYRLPTEAEWEKAARGGASGHRFPWSDADTITHSQANYDSRTNEIYDISPTRGYHPLFETLPLPYTSPVGFFAANGYGLYDMAGNVWEWCWDAFSDTYYASSPAGDPRGPNSGVYRVVRGGSWTTSPIGERCAYRNYWTPTHSFATGFGFRCVRGF